MFIRSVDWLYRGPVDQTFKLDEFPEFLRVTGKYLELELTEHVSPCELVPPLCN